MTARSPSAFMLSAALHAFVVGLALLLTYGASRRTEEMPKVFELVAGEGDNYAAREAPALGSPGVKLNVPATPPPKAEPLPPKPLPEPEPVAVKPAPPAPAPVKPAPTTKAPDTVPNFSKKIRRDIIVGDSKAKMQIARERAAEAKRLAEEKKRLSKEEFDRLNKSKSTGGSKAKNPKVASVDAEGIAKGVIGGSKNNKVGGAGGKALLNNSDDVLGAYFAMFKERLLERFELPPGVSDTLQVRVAFTSHADGSITNPRIVKSSGSSEFDRAVMDAIRRVTMPPRPDHKTEPVTFPFELHEREQP